MFSQARGRKIELSMARHCVWHDISDGSGTHALRKVAEIGCNFFGIDNDTSGTSVQDTEFPVAG